MSFRPPIAPSAVKITFNNSSATDSPFLGHLFQGGALGGDQGAARLFMEDDFDTFREHVATWKGNFAVAIRRGKELWAAVDRIRSIPLFYGHDKGDFFLSNDPYWVRGKVGDTEPDPLASTELWYMLYVLGDNTLSPGVKQLLAGEIMRVQADSDGFSIHKGDYYMYLNECDQGADEEGQGMAGPQGDNAPLIADPTNSGQSNLDTQNDYAAAGDEEATMALTPIPPMPPLIAELIAQHRQREALHRAEKSLTLQVKANCRWLCERDKAAAKTLYDAMMKEDPHALGELFWGANLPFINAREQIKPERLRIEKRMEEISVQFPVAEWWCEESGRNLLGLAQIIGETGDLSNYADPSKLWARLCVSVENGQAKKRRRGVDNGYNATRRSVSWRVSDSLFKGQSQLVDKETGEVKREAGPYRLVYDARKVREVEKAAEEGLEVRPAAKIPAAKASLYRSEGHIHKRAMRYMEKRQLKHLWQAWRAAIEQVEPIERLPPSEETPT